MPKGCIIYCIESGILEKHTLLSIASIKRFGGFLSLYDIFCIQPRREFPVSNSTIKKLQQFGVCFIDKPLNSKHRYYSILNKPLAIHYVIENYEYDQYIFLDSDTLILDEPLEFVNSTKKFLLSPVYTRGIGIDNLNARNGEYWQRLFDRTETNTENLPTVKTIYEREEIIAYWNAGIMVINGKNSVIRVWKDLVLTLLDHQEYPASGIFFVEQTSLAAALISKNMIPDQLSLSHNFPLSPKIFLAIEYSNLEKICVIHHLNNLHLLYQISSRLISEEKIKWIVWQMALLKISNNRCFEKWDLRVMQKQKKMMERFYYFIYRFTTKKKESAF